MNFTSKKTPLLILAITAIAGSRTALVLFDDPEGPNLLVVMGLAAIVYFLSLTAYLFKSSEQKKFWLAILIQIILLAGFYYFG